MSESPVTQIIEQFTRDAAVWPDAALEREWRWKDHEEGVRFAFFRLYQMLHELAVDIGRERRTGGPALTSAQHLLALHHTAYRDLFAVMLGVSEELIERPPAEGEWPIRTTLFHAIETEAGFFMQIEYAIERERSGDGRPLRQTEAAFYERFCQPPFEGLDSQKGSLAEILARYKGLHNSILNYGAGIRDDELDIPSQWWEAGPYPVRHRLGRFAAHLIQHTVQVEKTLAALVGPPSEAQRLLRRVYGALAQVEGGLIGAAEICREEQNKTADEVNALAGEVLAVAKQP